MKFKLTEYQIRKIITAFVYAVVIIFLIIVFVRGDLTVEKIISFTPKNLYLAALFFIFLYIFKSLTIVFPISILHIAAGMVFPSFWAIVINLLGTAVSFTLMYLVGKFSPTEKIDKKIQSYPKLKKAVELQQTNDWFLCYFLRVVSVLPFDAVSVYLGFLKIPFIRFFLGSFAGCLPSLIASTIIGNNIKDPSSPLFIISISIVVLLSLGSLFLYKILFKKKSKLNN